MQSIVLSTSLETGKLQVMHLKRFWEKSLFKKEGKITGNYINNEGQLDRMVLFVLGLGLEQVTAYLYSTVPSFSKFEDWIIETAGMPAQEDVIKFNQALLGKKDMAPGFATWG